MEPFGSCWLPKVQKPSLEEEVTSMEAKRDVAREIVLIIHVEKLVTSIGIVPDVIRGLKAHPMGKI